MSSPISRAAVEAAPWNLDGHGEFLVGGLPLSRVVAAVGGTPCYLYDRARVAERVASLRSALAPGVKLQYAIKANPMPALVGFMAGRVDGLDVSSGGELRVALDSGMPPREISFAGPGKSMAELRQAVAAGVLLNVESFRELRLLEAHSAELGVPARVAVRANLPFELRAAGMRMTGGPRPFGIDAERVPAMLEEIGQRGLAFEGFHLFAGSQNLRADAILEAQNQAYDCARRWADAAPGPVRTFNLGGGFGIPYSEQDVPLDVARVTEGLNLLADGQRREFPQAHITIELGRYLVGEAGLYVCTVIDRKVSRGEAILVVDGGMHQHLAASGNFGQLIRRNYPVAINGRRDGVERVSVVGPLCTPLDVLCGAGQLARAEEGDLVVVFVSGAYGRSASPTRFLGHPEPREALV